MTLGSKTFEFCNHLRRVSLPSTLRTIGSEAFSCCRSLESLDIPEGVESIGLYAFSHCGMLDSRILSDPRIQQPVPPDPAKKAARRAAVARIWSTDNILSVEDDLLELSGYPASQLPSSTSWRARVLMDLAEQYAHE